MHRFAGKSALVTGGTSGIGLATAVRLHAEGAKLWITGRSGKHIDEAKAVLEDAVIIANDGADPASAQDLAALVREGPGGIDLVFLNAGLGEFAPLDAIDADAIDKHVAINLRAPLLQAQALAPLIREGGAILLVSSATVGSPRADTLVYSATKAAIRQAARSLATQFAPRNIRVNVVTPGLTNTNFHASGGMSDDEEKDYKKKVEASIPLGRLGEPEDVAAVACFLLSDDARYVTGIEVRVDGGLTMA